MNVYTHFKTIEEYNVGYRWRTLLQFGSSWNIIGSVVMMNPGSAKYKYGKDTWITDPIVLSNLSKFDYPGDKGEKWFEFNSDQTLDCVADLFVQYMNVQNKSQLEGVIQIFNLFYLKDQNLNNAIKANKGLTIFNEINDSIFKQDIKNLKCPVYLGFGMLAKSPDFREKAECYFNEVVKNQDGKYLYPDFESNSFMHPRRLMRFRKNQPDGKLLISQFCSNKTQPSL